MSITSVAVLHNDRISEIDDASSEMGEAIYNFTSQNGLNENVADFGFGKIIAQSHSSDKQVIVVHDNTGKPINCLGSVSKDDLEYLSKLLRYHGCSVRLPWEKRAKSKVGDWSEKSE